MEVIEFLQGEWCNADDSNESYFVMGTSVRRTNSQGTKTFEKYLRWEDQWDAISWGPHQKFYLDTPKPQDETVHWSAYKRGAKPFRWNRPRTPVVLIPTKPQPKARPKQEPAPAVPKLAPKPKKRPQQSPQQVEGALRQEPSKVPNEAEAAEATKIAAGEVIPASFEMVQEAQVRLDESTLLGAEPGWERERLIARSLLSRGFRPTDPEGHSDEEAQVEELLEDEPEAKRHKGDGD